MAEPLTDEGGEDTGVKPDDELQKWHILKPEDWSPKQDSNPHNSICGRPGKQTC